MSRLLELALEAVARIKGDPVLDAASWRELRQHVQSGRRQADGHGEAHTSEDPDKKH